MKNKFLTATEKVKELLITYPAFRDNDQILMTVIWREELVKNSLPRTMSIDTIAKYMNEGILTKPETIRRTRAKLQEKFEHLRGETYEKRHAFKRTVIDELNQI